MTPPISPMPEDSGKPLCQQVNDLFDRHGNLGPHIRLRDELVVVFQWARYGQKAAAELEQE